MLEVRGKEKLDPLTIGSVKYPGYGLPFGNSMIQLSILGQLLGTSAIDTVNDETLNSETYVSFAVSSQVKSGVQSMTSIYVMKSIVKLES